jgi:hypothetical protein
MTDVNKMLVTDDGIRVSPEDADKFGLKTEGEVKLRSTGDRPKTTTALGRAAVKDDKSGRVITSAAERGADDGGTPYGENTGLGEVTKVATELPTDTAAADRGTPTAPDYEANPSASAPADTAAADKDTRDGTTASDQAEGSGDGNGDAGDKSKNRARRAAGH